MGISKQMRTLLPASFLRHKMPAALCLALCLSAAPQLVSAGDAPVVPVATDSRIKTFVYSENDVFDIVTHYGYQSNVEFGPEEHVETISVGDRLPFQIVPAGRRLFVRALMANARTNLTVVTDKHAYQFDLTSVPAPVMPNEELVYVVRFFYPGDKKNRSATVDMPMGPDVAMVGGAMDASRYNYKYTFSGSDAVAPLRVFDDGKVTYFKFHQAPGSSVPVVYAIDQAGKETLAPTRAVGDYLAVNTVAARFNVRQGDYSVVVYNDKLIHD